MGLRDELAVIRAERIPTGCKVGRLVAAIPVKERAELEELLADWGESTPPLVALIERRGWGKVSNSAMNEHRHGRCSCR